MISEKVKLFIEKGYCVAIYPNKFEKESVNNSRESILQGLSAMLLSSKYKVLQICIDSNDMVTDKYQIFYDEARVEIGIINKLSEFIQAVSNERSDLNNGDHIYYRGHSSTNYKLEPSIYREKNKKMLEAEDKMYRDILSSKPHFFNDCNTTLEKLVKMQHHGIPTRLLDLTENPLIALYFACIGNDSNNGEVLFFNIMEDKFKYFDSDTVSVVTNISKCKFNFDISSFDLNWTHSAIIKSLKPQKGIFMNYLSQSLRKESYTRYTKDWREEKVKEFNSNKIISELVHFIREDTPYFLNKVNPLHLMNYTVVVKPKMAIDRIINQSGAFILFGINMKKEVCSDCNINREGHKQKVIIIPKECKPYILKELRMFNINKSTVFGDLDSTAEFFVDKYK